MGKVKHLGPTGPEVEDDEDSCPFTESPKPPPDHGPCDSGDDDPDDEEDSGPWGTAGSSPAGSTIFFQQSQAILE